MGTSSKINSFYSLNSSNCSLVIDCRGNAPAILYWGGRLSDATNFEMLSLLSTSQELPAFPQEQAPITLSPEGAAGFEGSPGIQVHRDGYLKVCCIRESAPPVKNCGCIPTAINH